MTTLIANLEYDGNPPSIYCPACGTAIYHEGQEPNCPHVVFTLIHEIGEFDYVASHISDKAEAINELAESEGLDPEDMVESLMKSLNSTSILCFSITTNGIACGPTSSTVYVAIDFCPRDTEVQ